MTGNIPNPRANRRILRQTEQERRRYDDWRCYRCATWHRADEQPAGFTMTPAGYNMPYCGGPGCE